jgi:uncharacterized FAD-dependent dehydrogenase
MKVVIVGAGPAGLFAAHTLMEEAEVTILEQRRFVGGSGLHSDGKLNFHPLIGGDLTEFLSDSEAWDLVHGIREIFKELGVNLTAQDQEGLEKLEASASKAGIKFVQIEQAHIGSDHLPEIMTKMREKLENNGVSFKLNTRAEKIKTRKNKVASVQTSKKKIPAEAVLLSPGRIGSTWLINQMKELDVKMRYNPLDLGVRVEIPNQIIKEIIYDYGVWDPKFHLYTTSYDDFIRTFCVCPAGFVVREHYGNNLFGVNGHSMREKESKTTNFALLTRISLTEPLENTTEYGHQIAELANTLGGRLPILQRLGDLRNYQRSTWKRLERSHVTPTLKDVTPGDIAMAYPSRIVKNIIEGLEMLNRVIPGISADTTLLYAPEIKFYAMRIEADNRLQTNISNLYVAGDGAGVSRGIVGAAATGIVAAKGLLNKT